MEHVKKIVHADYAYRRGITGKNITVVIMDTGIVPHPDFENRIIHFEDFCYKKKEMYDDNGHGTHVAGIIGGRNGMAPGARLIMLKVLDKKGRGNTVDVLEGIQWVLKWRSFFQIRLLNISVGMLPTAQPLEQKKLLDAVDQLWDAGVMVVAAAGNNGPMEQSITIPGISRKIVTVGSSDDESPGEMNLPGGYSGKGPTRCCVVKPEILAPGTRIVSCSYRGRGYTVKSGTSMAAPVVTGALALAFEQNPLLTPAEMKLRLYERVSPRGKQLGKKCWGMLHVENLLR